MQNHLKGFCCVCAAPTIKRCSACGKGAEFDIYFCSTKCQNLVWFVHKRVCGENAKPFRFPAFSKGEVMEVKEILQLNETRGCLMRSVVVEGLEGSVGTDAPAIVDSLSEQHPAGIDEETRNAKLCRVRSVLHGPYSRVIFTYQNTGLAMVMGSTSADDQTRDAVRFVGHVASTLSNDIAALDPSLPRYPVDKQWYLFFLHHAHIYAAMRYKHSMITNPPAGTPPAPFEQHRISHYLCGWMRNSAWLIKEATKMCEREDPRLHPAVLETHKILFQGYDDHPKFDKKEGEEGKAAQ